MPALDSFSLESRRALVTGGNRGLGLAFTRALGEAGSQVVFAARDAARNAAAETALRDEGLDVSAVQLDITTTDGPKHAVQETCNRLGGIDILVNNAGVARHRPALDIEDDEWDQVIDLDLRALWRTCRAAAMPMIAAGGGSIVNIGSISAMIVNRPQWQPSYNAAKAAVHQLTRSLAAEWAPHGIRVNAVAPGYVKTDMAPVDEPRFRRQWIEDAPMQRYATPEEIAPSVVFLASDAASFMTGSILVIDGGYTLH